MAQTASDKPDKTSLRTCNISGSPAQRSKYRSISSSHSAMPSSASSSSWRRGQALPPPPPSAAASASTNTNNSNRNTSNSSAAGSNRKPAATLIPPTPAVNPWGSATSATATATATASAAKNTNNANASASSSPAWSTAGAATSAAASAGNSNSSSHARPSAWGKAATAASSGGEREGGKGGKSGGGVQILQRQGQGQRQGQSGGDKKLSFGNNMQRQQQQQAQTQKPKKKSNSMPASKQQRKVNNNNNNNNSNNNKRAQEEFPSLRLQLHAQSDFPSLGTSGGNAGNAGATATTNGTTANRKILTRGWEAPKSNSKPKAKAVDEKKGAISSSGGGGAAASGGQSQKKKKAPSSDTTKATAADKESAKNNKKTKPKKKGKKDKVPSDPRLAAAFAKLPAERTDDAHAAHMIHFPLASAAKTAGADKGAGTGGRGATAALAIAKGRQRLGPRKKRLSTLKKRVLQERLKVWKEMNGIIAEEEGAVVNDEKGANAIAASGAEPPTAYHTVCLRNFVTDEEELIDDDEYEEIVSDLLHLAKKIGPVAEVYIPRRNDDGSGDGEEHDTAVVGLAFVRYRKEYDARAAIASFDALTIGGGKIEPLAVVADGTVNGAEGDEWRSLMHRYSPSDAATSEAAAASSATDTGGSSGDSTVVVVLENILSEDDFEDEDCLAESIDDIRALVKQFGTVVDVTPHSDGERKGQVHVTYKGDGSTGKNAATKLNGMVIGGSSISAKVLRDGTADFNHVDSPPTLILENILTEDDLEDEDCLQESVEDILGMCKKIGEIASIKAHIEGDQKGQVHVVYTGDKSANNAKAAVAAFNGKLVGGETISARLDMPLSSAEASSVLILRNLITEDDYEDEDVLEETKADTMEMLQKYGKVEEMKVHVDGDHKGEIHVTYAGGNDIISKAQAEIHGIVRGGQTIEAEIFAPDSSTSNPSTTNDADGGDAEKPKPMFSGDKVIPERYAECKRAPKVPNKGVPRAYATKIDDDTVVPLINEMLGELMRLQLRSKDDKNARARRRLVMGLREVARGIKSHKVKMVIMADNLDEYGAIDDKLQEILDLAEKEDVPVFFELSKRRLGKALGKSIKVAVVGIYSADGAYQQFKQLQKIYLRAPRKAPPPAKD